MEGSLEVYVIFPSYILGLTVTFVWITSPTLNESYSPSSSNNVVVGISVPTDNDSLSLEDK